MVEERWEGKQKVAGVEDPNSGGHRIFLSPGARFVSGGGWVAYASLGFPVLQNSHGAQADTQLRLTAGVAAGF